VSCLSRRFVDKIGAVLSKNENLEKLTTADGRNLRIQGSVEVTVGLRGLLVPHQFYVIEGLNHNALIGLDFLHVTDCKLDLRSAMVSFFGGLVVLPLQEKARDSAVLRTSACYVIPPRSEGLLPGYCNSMVCTFDVLECYDMVGNGGRGKGTTAASRRGANCSGVTVTEIVARGEQ